jgi:protein-S-isoprenylcysteine O-methyltransferase Ste14
MREKEPQQRCIMGLAWLWFVVTYLAPGFDKRFHGSAVPALAVILAELFIVLGYGLIFWVFRENPYASRIVEVEPDQAVVSTGPYAVVHHPMYLGVLLIYLFTSLALGSCWAILPTAFIIPILTARIRNEEKVLERDLKGYRDYLQRTRYRLLPGIW